MPTAIHRNRLPGHVLVHRQHDGYRSYILHRPKCPMGIRLGFAFGLLVTMSVSINAGAMAFTVIPRFSSSGTQLMALAARIGAAIRA
jgi:hypothetical protein